MKEKPDCPLSISDWMQYLDSQKSWFFALWDNKQRQWSYLYSLLAIFFVYFVFTFQLTLSERIDPIIFLLLQIPLILIFNLAWRQIKHIKTLKLEVQAELSKKAMHLQSDIIDGKFGNDSNLIREEYWKGFEELADEIIAYCHS